MKRKSGMQWRVYLDKTNPQTNKNFTKEEAKKHVSSFRKSSIYYWIKRGYNEIDAKQQVFNYQQEMSKRSNYKHANRKDRVPNQIGYWTKKGYSELEAKEKVKLNQTNFSLKICIEKYGEKIGINKWKERQIKWQTTLKNKSKEELSILNSKKSHSLQHFIKLYGTDTGLNEYKKYRIHRKANSYIINKTINYIRKTKKYEEFNIIYKLFLYEYYKKTGKASKESLKYFIPLYKFCRKNLHMIRSNIRLGVSGSKELYINKNNKRYFFDFCCLNEKIIIEYNNVDWHPNPFILSEKEWQEWKHPYNSNKITALDMYNKETKKLQSIEKEGFYVIIIWSNKNFEEQLENVKRELLNKCK